MVQAADVPGPHLSFAKLTNRCSTRPVGAAKLSVMAPKEVGLRLFSLVLALVAGNVFSSENLIYLTCEGVVTDTAFDKEVKKVKNDFLINKDDKTIQQIITGLTEEQTGNLRMRYVETPTQFVSENGLLSINRRTLEYSVDGVMSTRINGDCKIVKPEL